MDATNQRLHAPSGLVLLNPKAFDVLRVLVERAGQLVTKDALLGAVWPPTHVGDGVLKVCVSEIRSALGDSPSAPRFIETVHRRGYRFIAQTTAARPETLASPSLVTWPPESLPLARSAVGLVGRRREIELLDDRLGRALDGQRQMVFVTGAPGAGKTALLEDFVTAAARREALAVTEGQCIASPAATEWCRMTRNATTGTRIPSTGVTPV